MVALRGACRFVGCHSWPRCLWLIFFVIPNLWSTRISAEWQTFNRADGLVSNRILAVFEDRMNLLWFGSDNQGVSRYDGRAWTTYTKEDGLVDDHVTSVADDNMGGIWFGTGAGVSFLDDDTWTTYTTASTANGLVNNQVQRILRDQTGNLWFGTEGGVSRFDGETWTAYTMASTANGLVSDDVQTVLQDHSGNLWFGTKRGVSRFDGETWTTYMTVDTLASNSVRTILEDHLGSLWFGTDGGGVVHFDGENWVTYTMADGLASDFVNSSVEDREGNLWFGTGDSVSHFDGLIWTTYTTADAPVAAVSSIIRDHSGNLWFGSSRSGVSRYDGSVWTTYATPSELASVVVRALLEDHTGNLWFGTYWGLSRYDGSTWTRYDASEGVPVLDIHALAEDDSGNLWIGTAEGVTRFDGDNWTTYTTVNGLGSNYVVALLNDHAGNVWAGTFGGGVSRYDGSEWTTYTPADGLAGPVVLAICEDHTGNLWFGTLDGVSCYDGSIWTTYTIVDGLAQNFVRAIVEDEGRNLWFGTKGGVSRFDGSVWTTYTEADGLAANDVRAVLEDRAGNLWFGTWRGGVTRYDGSAWTTYTTVDGLPRNSINALLEDQWGSLWFAIEGGGATQYVVDVVPPRAVLVPMPATVVPSRFVSMAFVAAFEEQRVVFSHSLDDAMWSPWSTMTNVVLRSLLDGPHVFKVLARDRSGNVQIDTTVVAFEVDATPPSPTILPSSIGHPISGTVTISGKATDTRFKEYSLRYRPEAAASWDSATVTLIATSSTPVVEGPLAEWDASSVPDGPYELRLDVTDSLGLIGSDFARVIVDNQAPSAEVTSPVYLTREAGGGLFTQDGQAHLYLPPLALSGDAWVAVESLDDASLPGDPPGTTQYLAGYSVDFAGVDLEKAGTLDALLDAGADTGEGTPVAYVLEFDEAWRRLGGTMDGQRVSIPIHAAGRFGIFLETVAPEGRPSVTGLSFTPRVLSRQGIYSADEVAIGFTLGRSGPVTAQVFNRAGRLVRELASNTNLKAGQNVVRWDGCDVNGARVEDGLYLVTIQSLNQRQTRGIAVVR